MQSNDPLPTHKETHSFHTATARACAFICLSLYSHPRSTKHCPSTIGTLWQLRFLSRHKALCAFITLPLLRLCVHRPDPCMFYHHADFWWKCWSSPPLATFMWSGKSRAKSHSSLLQRIPLYLISRALRHPQVHACALFDYTACCSRGNSNNMQHRVLGQRHSICEDYSPMLHLKALPLGCYGILIPKLIDGLFVREKQ